MTAGSIDATTRVLSLIAITEELTEIFNRENAALNAHRPRDMAPFQADKARLAAAYAQSIRDIALDRTAVAGAGTVLMEKLRELTRNFEERAGQQKTLLDGARVAAEGVVRAVAAEAGAAAAGPAYAPSVGTAPSPAAVAFNMKA